MSALYPPTAAPGNDQVVRRPCATDAIGTALRGAYGAPVVLPADVTKLLQTLDRLR